LRTLSNAAQAIALAQEIEISIIATKKINKNKKLPK
jgi:hypothetical protein